MDSGRVFIFW
jgi:hypothetical protein